MKATVVSFLIASFSVISLSGDAQVLISLIFGDALNTPKIEFGLVGGMNRSYLLDRTDSKPSNNFNIGFYFHINIKNNSFLGTGVLVKSNVGAKEMPTYSTGDADFDNLYADGFLEKKINYFYVPILYHHRIKNRVYLEGGFQVGLRGKAYDIFTTTYQDGDLSWESDTRDQYKHLDAGLMGTVGYKTKRVIKSMSIGIGYYYGLVNVSSVDGVTLKNSSIYFYVKIPIGLAKKDSEAGS